MLIVDTDVLFGDPTKYYLLHLLWVQYVRQVNIAYCFSGIYSATHLSNLIATIFPPVVL